MKKKLIRDIWISGALLVCLFALIFVWVFLVGIKTAKPGSFFNKGENAIWVAHEWVGEWKSDAEIRGLVSRLSAHGISTIYLHVGPLDEYGFINSSIYKEAVNFVDKVRESSPDMKILAWMGQVRGKLDLGSGSVRHNILNMCMIFTEMIGMDGVHYDVEPVWDDDVDFIKLLQETRAQFDKAEVYSSGGVLDGTVVDLSKIEVIDGGGGSDITGNGVGGAIGSIKFENPKRHRILSVALAEFIPSSFIWWTSNVADYKNYNTEKNYLNVARYADQIVDMVYDTGIDRDYVYRWLVKEQVIRVGDLLGGDVEFLIGVPAYEKGDGHNPEVENIENALFGVLNGLNDIRSDEGAFTGIAVYPEWEMDDAEWEVWDVVWGK